MINAKSALLFLGLDTFKTDNPYPFINGGGELGELTRRFDWSKTALGAPDQWSQSLRTLVNMMLTSRFPMLVFWGPELITFYNDAFRPSLGDDGKHPSSLGQRGEQSWAESWPVIGPMIYNIMAGGEAVWVEDQKLPIYRDGQMGFAYWTYSFSPLTDDTGSINGVLVTCSETTQAVLNRQKTEETQQEVLAFFEQSPVAIAIIDKENLVFRLANPFYGNLFGRTPEEIVGKSLLEALPELSGQGFDQLLKEVVSTGKPFIANEVSVDIVRNNQLETIYVDLTYQPRREADSHISGILVVATDVTAQVLARKKIEESEARFRALIAQAPVATGLLVGRELVIEEVNEPMIKFWGKGADVLGKTLAELLPELQNQPFMKILDEVYVTGKAYHATDDRCDLVIDGQLQTFYFNFTYQPIFNEQGQVYAILDMAVDVTPQILAQKQVEESEASLRSAIDIAELGTWSVDIATGEAQFSQRYIDMFGLSNAEVNLQKMMSCVVEEDRERVAKAFQEVQQPDSDGKYEAEYTIINASTGKRYVIHALGQTYFDQDGTPTRIAGTAQDLTIQRELKVALENEVQLRTEELAATNEELTATNEELATTNEELTESAALLMRSNENLQTFAYVASHDLQEPLRKIQQFGDLLRTQCANSDGNQLTYVERMQSAANRMSMLIRDLLNFSRISTRRDESRFLSLNDIVRSVLTDLELVIAETNAKIQVALLPEVNGDPSQLGQLFQNLISNALKFSRVDSSETATIPQITIRYKLVEAIDVPLSVKPGRISAQYHRIDVTDNGIGFDEKYLDRIFQVFQRLHGRTEYAGTGIGLAICEKVVANHGGAITASSKPGQGATFRVYLPR